MRDYFLLAFNNLTRRKLRSWLTMIGIFIGIAAVVALISIGQGFQKAIENEFESLGKDKIIIEPKTMGPPGSVTSKSLLLTSNDLEFIRKIKGVDWASGYLIKTSEINFKEFGEIAFAIGVDTNEIERIEEIQNLKILEGRSLKDGDRFKVVVGYDHCKDGKIWDKGVKLKENIEIEGQQFKIIGIYEKKGNPYDDGAVYVSKEILMDILNVEDEESQIILKVKGGENPVDVAEEIKRKLRNFRNEKENQETFSIQTSEQILNSFKNIFGIVQAVLVGIASISLLVGGIGIMNTMYTSVLERTKEIGTLKAIGAKNSDILKIFLFESGLLGLVGGVIGVLIGVCLGKGAEYIGKAVLQSNYLQASFPAYLLIGAIAFSFFIGTISGILPALQASKLKPARALRYE